MHLLAAESAPDGLLDPKPAPDGLGSLAALAGRIAHGRDRFLIPRCTFLILTMHLAGRIAHGRDRFFKTKK
jgi:hypothetical protein